MLEQKGQQLQYLAILQVVAWFSLTSQIEVKQTLTSVVHIIIISHKSLLIPSDEHKTLVFVWNFHYRVSERPCSQSEEP